MTSLSLSMDELRTWCALTLDAVEREAGATLSLPRGPYSFMQPSNIWEVPPASPTMGDSGDDVTTLRQELQEPHDDMIAWHSLAHLIGLLSVIGSQIDPLVQTAKPVSDA